MTAANAMTKPYKDERANRTATLSYLANICLAALNLVKANYVAFGCDTDCQFRDTVIQYMGIFEEALLLYVPLVTIVLWFLCSRLQKCLRKGKGKTV